MDFLDFLEVATLEEARELDIFYVRDKYAEYVRNASRMFTVEDGQFCMGDPLVLFLQGKCADVSVMAGNTVDEFLSFPGAILEKRGDLPGDLCYDRRKWNL